MAITPTAHYRIAFYRLAREAVRLGLLTVEERDLLRRARTRKSNYWGGHLVRLRALLRERLAALPAEHVAGDKHLRCLTQEVNRRPPYKERQN